MKSFIRTIIVFAALSLAAGSFALAQNAHEKEDMERAKEKMEALKIEMKQAVQKVKKEVDLARKEEERVLKEVERGPSLVVSSTPRLFTKTSQHSATSRVLVIPTQQIKAENLVMIMEDMSVMSRIFDKKFSKGSLMVREVFPDYRDFFRQDSRATEAIYLQGYGALFLMQANFPLTAPPKSKEKEAKKTEEPADPIWQRTKQEIFDPMIRTTRRISQPGEKYDAEQIEEVKKELIKSLKHAANIRNLKPDEWVILTVTGAGRQPNEVFEYGRLIRPSGATGSAGGYGGYGGGGYSGSYRERGSPSAIVLTIRAKKADVDAFAKGELDYEKFREKVQLFTYPSLGQQVGRGYLFSVPLTRPTVPEPPGF